MSGWGQVFGKIAEWLPGRRESKQNEIAKLRNENAKLAKEYPLSVQSANRIERNADRIKQLRAEIDRIA